MVAAILLVAPTAPASADPFLPPAHEIFQGNTGKPVASYSDAVGKHPAVYQEFVGWGQWLPGITQDAIDAHARMMMSITTGYGSGEAITPGGIARGDGDAWLIGLQKAISDSKNITYIRLMGEMDGYWNPYCAFNADGTRRDPDHSAFQYKQAWKRVTLIMRGGSLIWINAVLHKLHMPPLNATSDLPQPQVAMLWVPQVAPGDPDVQGNMPRDYWPGRPWVDWVGTDFYSAFPNFTGLTAFYKSFRSKPFMFGEYAIWKSGDDAGFIGSFFRWIAAHRRVRMLIYNQGQYDPNPWWLSNYPNAARALGRALASWRFPDYAPEWAPSPSTGNPGVSTRHGGRRRRVARKRKRHHHRRQR